MVVYLGRSPSASRPDWGWIAPGEMVGTTFDTLGQHLWVYKLGIWGGRYTGGSTANVLARVALYGTSSLNPANRLGYSNQMTISSVMNDIAGGNENAATIAAVDVSEPAGTDFTAIPVASGYNYHLAVLGTSGYLGFGMIQAASISAQNESFYYRSGLSQPPPNPFGNYTTSYEGHLAIWAEADVNVAPNTPTGLSPAGQTLETAPTFSANFIDGNTNRGDYLNQYRIQVRRKSDQSMFWNITVSASSSERANDAIGRVYGGTALVRGTEYEWRTQVSDHFSTWSPWTGWTAFTPTAKGTVGVSGSISGKQEDNTPDFTGLTWTHQTGATMKTVQARILNGSGSTVLQTGANYDIADVANGATFTLPWANAGLSALAWGTSYQFQVRGYDGTEWSDWSAARSFSTNAAPSIPSGLSPTNSFPTSSYPLLRCSCTDPDDTVGTGLQVFARVKDSGGTVLGTYAMTLSGAQWQLQTNATHLPAYGTYRWDAYSYDGTLYSGEKTSAATATKSTEATFIYAAGPTVTVTAPTDGAIITTSNLDVVWSTTDQAKYRVYLYEDGTDIVVYDSGIVTSTSSSHVIPSGYLHNDTAYDLVVWVEDTTPLSGQSAIVNITVDYVEPDAIVNVRAEAVRIGSDIWPSAIAVTWDQTTAGTDIWQEYTVVREAASGVDQVPVIMARITSPAQTSWTDYTPASGIEYTYTVTQTTMVGVDTLTSPDVSASASVALGGVVLVSVSAPETLRTTLRYTRERTFAPTTVRATYTPASGADPTIVRARTHYYEPSFEAQLFADASAPASQRRDELVALDEAGDTVCYRDNHGRKLFLDMTATITDQVPDWYTASVEGIETFFREGEV